MTSLHKELFDCLAPLTQFYETQELPALHLRPMDGSEVPQPYRDLLVHERDMTSTLSAYWNAPLQLRVLERNLDEHLLTREVILVTTTGRTIAEFGAIRIHLDRFNRPARDEIEAGVDPLGAILDRHGVAYQCRPNAFFSCHADDRIQRLLGMDGDDTVYGRHNMLVDSHGATLAEVVEILPPITSSSTR